MQRLALAFVLVLGCSGEEASKPSSQTPPPEQAKQPDPEPENQPEPETLPEPAATKDGFFMAEGAPDPSACKVAADCHGNTIPDPNNPCCQDPRTLEPHARAYSTWLSSWRRDNCASVTCPPPPPPAEPPACAFEVDCVAGSCVDACP